MIENAVNNCRYCQVSKNMKDYLKNNKPKFSLLLVCVFFISNILTTLNQDLYQLVLLFPQDIKNISTWYKLLTYPFYTGGLLKWFYSGIIIILSGYIIELRLSKVKLVALIALSSIIGGLIFSTINISDPLNIPIASPVMIIWGLSSCAFMLILRNIKSSNLFEKIVAALFVISLLSIESFDYGFVLGQICVIIFGLLFGLVFGESKSIANIELTNTLSD